MKWINAPICERCWIRREGTWEIDEAEGFEYLSAVRVPVRLLNPSTDGEFRVEVCHFCHEPTIGGIYVRAAVPDPPTVRDTDVPRW